MAEKQLYPVFISIHALREEGDGLCCEGRHFER